MYVETRQNMERTEKQLQSTLQILLSRGPSTGQAQWREQMNLVNNDEISSIVTRTTKYDDRFKHTDS